MPSSLTAPASDTAALLVIRTLCQLAAIVAAAAVGPGCSAGSDQALPDPSTEAGHLAHVQRGKALYNQHGCADCHGPAGHGDGRIAHSLQPPPRDFRLPGNFRHGYTVEQIASTIRDGVAYDRRVMPRYAHLSVQERQALARYIRSLGNAGQGASQVPINRQTSP